MRRHSSGFYIGIVMSIILGFGTAAGIAPGLRSLSGPGYNPDVYQATRPGPNSFITVIIKNYVPTSITINGNQYPPPNVISFQFRTGPSGTYIWRCYDPCRDQLGRNAPFGFSGLMSTTGYKAGTITVASYEGRV